MKAVFSANQLGHAPTWFLSKGEMIDYPESPDRARALLEGVRKAGANIFASRLFDASIYRRVHLQPYVDFLKTGFTEWQQIEGAGPEMMPSLRPTILPAVKNDSIIGKAGLYMMDFSCAITGKTWKSVEASALTAVTAADMVMKGDPVVYALCRPPGHHAYANRAGGFCYLNNTALAAQHLRSMHKKVAILDVDVHHGNGTQSIFYRRADVLTVSIHADPKNFYPFYWGGADETGESEGNGFNVNLPLPVGSGDGPWMTALETAAARIRAYEPGALVLALGLDAHEADPLKGGAVTTGGFVRIAKEIAALQLPTVIVQEGGYLTEHLSENLATFLRAFKSAHKLKEPAAESPPEG